MKKVFLYFFLVITYILGLHLSLNAQQLQRQVAISAYIYNFAKNIQWENEENIKEFHFLIISDDKTIIKEMKTLSEAKKLRNKPIVISSSLTLNNTENLQLIFVAKENEKDIAAIYKQIEGKNILLISDNYIDNQSIMINFFDSDKGKLLFEINKDNIVKQHLKIMPNMILLGGSVVDVAELYSEGQIKLQDLQKHIKNLDSNLIQLENIIAIKSNEVNVNKDSLNKQTLKIQKQQNILDLQSQLLKKRENDLLSKSIQIYQQEEIFNLQSKNILEQTKELKKGNELLRSQKQNILDQKSEMLSQTKILNQQDQQIHQQRNVMYLLIVIIILVVITVLSVLFGYLSKKRLNKELESTVIELKVAKEKINLLNETLEERVKIRTEQLEDAYNEMEAFTYSVSHDLRAPIRAIDGFSHLLLLDNINLEPETVRLLNVICDSSRNMGKLIDDLLSFSRIGRANISLVPINMKDILNAVLAQLNRENLTINTTINIKELKDTAGDSVLLEQIWTNLIRNAVKFSSKKENPLIEIGSYVNKKEVVYYIKDNGVGFEMKYVDKLFGVFQRLHSSDEYEGTGIGLAIVRKALIRQGGRVWAESTLGEGASFFFALQLIK